MKKITLNDCSGCEQNFYNGNNPYGVKKCWSFDKAKIVTRYKLSVDCPCNRKSGYYKMEVPNCYEQKRYVFCEEIPNYAKTDSERRGK